MFTFSCYLKVAVFVFLFSFSCLSLRFDCLPPSPVFCLHLCFVFTCSLSPLVTALYSVSVFHLLCCQFLMSCSVWVLLSVPFSVALFLHFTLFPSVFFHLLCFWLLVFHLHFHTSAQLALCFFILTFWLFHLRWICVFTFSDVEVVLYCH